MNVYTLWVLRHIAGLPEILVSVDENTEDARPGTFSARCSAALAALEGNVVSSGQITVELDQAAVLRVLRSDHALVGRVVERVAEADR